MPAVQKPHCSAWLRRKACCKSDSPSISLFRPSTGIDLAAFGLHGQGEMLPRFENAVSLHPTRKDKWGMPLLHIDASHCDNDRKMREDMADTAANILEYLGVKDVRKTIATAEEYPPGLAIHEMGTARMGRDPKTSVLNGFNQAHDVPNLFVTDGASMASGAWQNPSLTFMALTARASAYVVDEMKAGRI